MLTDFASFRVVKCNAWFVLCFRDADRLQKFRDDSKRLQRDKQVEKMRNGGKLGEMRGKLMCQLCLEVRNDQKRWCHQAIIGFVKLLSV